MRGDFFTAATRHNIQLPVREAGAVEVRDPIDDTISEGCIQTDWQERYVFNLCKGKGDTLIKGFNRELELVEQAMKMLEHLVEGLIKQRVEIVEIESGFMSGRSTTDALFIVCQLHEKHLVQTSLY